MEASGEVVMRKTVFEIVGIVVLVSSLAFTGSSRAAGPEDDPMERAGTWVGAHVDDVIAKWGNPSEKKRDGRGGWTLAYLGSETGAVTPQIGVGLPSRVPPSRPPDPNLPRFTEAAFYIGADDLVYDYWFAPSAYKRLARQGLTTPPAGAGRAREALTEQAVTPGEPRAPEWSLRGKTESTMFVYISPAGLGDEQFVAGVLGNLVRENGEAEPLTVMIFDDAIFTPTEFPLTSGQRFRQKAEYTYDPAGEKERFVWLSIKDPLRSPVEFEEEETDIRADLGG
jgi:hypothetical protein